jgi:FkbM family methyltransferase
MVFSGESEPWGYIATAVLPRLLHEPRVLRVKARVNIRKGSVGLGILMPDETAFYKQTVATATGAQVIALETDCSVGPGPIMLRYGQATAGETEFELESLEVQVPAGEAFPDRLRPDVHPIFSRFPRWSGTVSAGCGANWVGTMTNLEYRGRSRSGSGATIVRPRLPPLEEEYFEWIDLLEAVAEARDSFTMVELGAGWGRWLVDAWGALCRIDKSDLPVQLIGVEAEPQHFAWMRDHFRNNGLDPDRHRLIEAAVMARDGSTGFQIGAATDWYGQQALNIDNDLGGCLPDYPDVSLRRVPAVSLSTVLDGIPFVDLIDMDIQGSEADVVLASIDLLQAQVRRVHIGTHCEAIEASLRQAFRSMGWTCRWDFSLQGHRDTPYGRVLFGDGVQGWINPRL